MARAPKKCGRLDCPTLVVGVTYCDAHKRRPPSPSSLAARSSAEKQRRSAVVKAWVRVNGWICPGYERPAHESTDLTAAHSVAVAFGGDEIGGILCRSCNSRQNTKPS